ncbi:hypothetical protein AX17_004396 [Amanita inopinata Kibby_2008]|nr:hypothetical protein AX17_004396 [Amanita inopinata Kibby_2008]
MPSNIASMPSSSSYVCDTIPPAKLAKKPTTHTTPPGQSSPPPVSNDLEPPMIFEHATSLDDVFNPTSNSRAEEPGHNESTPPPAPQQPSPRKLCVRHQRMADEGMNLKLQQSLDALPETERQVVNSVWSNFSSSSHPRRALILQGILTMCCFSQLSLLTEQLSHLIRIDPFVVLPREVSLKILSYLDATSLCRAAQVARRWKALADDDILWRGICEQHIGQKCKKCGWGLPILEKSRTYRFRSGSPCPPPSLVIPSFSSPPPVLPSTSLKRSGEEMSVETVPRPVKRLCSESYRCPQSFTRDALSPAFHAETPSALVVPNSPELASKGSVTRPWKDVYSERMTIERNWRRGRCTVRTLKGHTDGVMCLQFNETLSHPAFPILITGSYDYTARVWNLETGAELHCLKGHTRAVRALQFDEVKLITGSMDNTIKVWDWRRGKCIRTLVGHTDGVVSLHFDSNVLASGSVDSTIRVWNFRSGGAFTLRGHSDWVNAVQLWDSGSPTPAEPSESMLCMQGSTSPRINAVAAPQIDVGKMLFSASDDGTIKLWDLNLRTCVRQFSGHIGQVQSMKLLLSEECGESGQDPEEVESTEISPVGGNGALEKQIRISSPVPSPSPSGSERKKPLLVSGSLDNTVKIWDIESGKAIRTFFGHIEGVWSVACDKLRLVSGSHDRTIKVWSRDEGRCTATLVGHQAAVSCIALGEDKIISGSDDWDVKIWSFSG